MSNLSAFMQPNVEQVKNHKYVCLLYTSDAADE